jgi:hypothetical protein
MTVRTLCLVGLSCISCYGVSDEELTSPGEDAIAVAPTDAIPDQPEAPPLQWEPVSHEPTVGPLLVRIKSEPTAWGLPHSFAQTDAGRGPWFSLYTDGTMIWRVDGSLKRARLRHASADQLHADLLALGVGTIPSYEKTSRPSEGAKCVDRRGVWSPCKPGGTLTVSDVHVEVWEISTASGETRTSRHYAGWAPGHDAQLQAARDRIGVAANEATEHAESYEATTASLLLREVDFMPDAAPWPLEPGIVAATVAEGELVMIVEGDPLEAMAEYIPGYGRRHFVRDGHIIEAMLVPWLPDQDWRAEVEAFEPPMRGQAPISAR